MKKYLGSRRLWLLINYGQSYFNKLTMRFSHQVLLLVGVCLWYASSIMVNVHWKSTLKDYGLSNSMTIQHYQFAIFFTTVQFAGGAATSFILIVCSGKLGNLTTISIWFSKGVVISVLFYLGQLCTNMSLTMNSVTMTHMVKTLEPLLALMWALTILKNKISYVSIIHMQIMLIGVLLTSYTEVKFNVIGVTFALVSNFSLSLRNLFIKLSNNSEMLNGLQLFFVSCFFGFIYSLLLYVFSQYGYVNNDFNFFSVESIKMGIYFSGQHIMSYLLLYYISITTHALLNCVKRALIIFTSAIILGIQLPTLQIIGIIITITGTIFYVFEISKPLPCKSEDKGMSDLSDKITQNVGYTFSKSYKLILLLPLVLIFCFSVIKNNHYNESSLRELQNESVTAVWAYDAPLNMKSLEFVKSKLEKGVTSLNIFCSNVEKCKESAIKFDAKNLFIQITQLKAFELSKGTPMAAWIASHPINKINSLTCFPVYFHKMMYLSVLWKYGRVVIDMGLDATESSDINHFMISSFVRGCLFDQSESSALICNLTPQHKYTEFLMGEVSKMFTKDPKTCIFNSSLQNMDNLTMTVMSQVGYSIPLSNIKFGLLGYGATHNLGDEMQSIAAAHILPHIYTYIDRQTFTNPDRINLTYISNAWWDANGILFKDIPHLITVPVAVHISPPAYKAMMLSRSLLTAMAPIGARDLTTNKQLMKNGIDSMFTGCLTLWMMNPNLSTKFKRNNQTIIVDLVMKPDPIPKTLRNVKYMSHQWNSEYNPHISRLSKEDKFMNAFEKLMEYSQAKLVVTSRIHVALPCVAIGTPVIFMNSKQIWDAGSGPPPRVVGLLDLFHTVDMYKMNETSALEYFNNFNWDNPPPNPNPNKVKALKREARKILERVPELVVSLKVFELI